MRAKLAALGAALLAGLAFFIRFQAVKNQRDKAKQHSEVLQAQVHTLKVRGKIERETIAKEKSREIEIINELKKPKEEREYPNFTKPNDY